MSDRTPENPFQRYAPVPQLTVPTKRRVRGGPPPALSPREAHFATRVVEGHDPLVAMRLAKYPAPSRDAAEALLAEPAIAEAIAEQQEALAAVAHLTLQRVIAEHAHMAFSDIAEVAGALRGGGQTVDEALSALPRRVTAAIRKMKITRRYEGRGDDAEPVDTVEIELHDKHRSLDALAKVADLYRSPETEEALTTFGEMLRAAAKSRGVEA